MVSARLEMSICLLLSLLSVARAFSPQPPAFVCIDFENCFCDDLGIVVGVTCSNVTDFHALTMALNEKFPNAVFRLELRATDSLSSKAFQGLLIEKLVVNGDLATVPKDTFVGLRNMFTLHVRSSYLREIPNFTSLEPWIVRLNIDSSLLKEVGTELQNLSVLQYLSLSNNSIKSVAEDAFSGTSAIRILDLSFNDLVTLPVDLLNEIKNLTKLNLAHNQIVSVDGLFQLAIPKHLFLDHNNLTDVSKAFHEKMSITETIQLSNNPLRKITNDTFNGKLPSLRFLYLHDTGLTEFEARNFMALPRLSSLGLANNKISEIRNQTVDFGIRLEIFLSHNLIHTFDCQITYKIIRVFLNGNKIQQLGEAFRYMQLNVLDLSNNGLTIIEHQNFLNAQQTETVFLAHNAISRIHKNSFVTLRGDLHHLDLSDNNLSSLNDSLQFLCQLRSLNVSYNQLESFSNWEFFGLTELTELYLQSNRIQTLGGQLQKMPQLQFMKLRDNWITTIESSDLPSSLKFLSLMGNPFNCDCRLFAFLHWLEYSKDVPEIDNPLCPLPDSAANETPWPTHHQLEMKNLSVHLPPSKDIVHCPRSCSCSCSNDSTQSYVAVDCSSQAFNDVPDSLLVKNGESSSLLFEIIDPRFKVYDQALAINLENNSISSLGNRSFPHLLRALQLANNQFQHLPDDIRELKELNQVTLGGNPWTCDCSTIPFRKWLLSKGDSVEDVNRTLCGSRQKITALENRPIILLSELDLCPSTLALYISGFIGALCFLLVCAGAKIAYIRYEMNIKVWLYAHGITWVKEKEIDENKEYDAFLSYSEKDESLVLYDILKGAVERQPQTRWCLHERDFIGGNFIHENINTFTSKSKRVVVILSRNYLQSKWCMYEFRVAHMRSLEEGIQRVIIIKIDDLPEEVDPDIQVHLDSTTYITWRDKYFWEKFIYALPVPRLVDIEEECMPLLN